MADGRSFAVRSKPSKCIPDSGDWSPFIKMLDDEGLVCWGIYDLTTCEAHTESTHSHGNRVLLSIDKTALCNMFEMDKEKYTSCVKPMKDLADGLRIDRVPHRAVSADENFVAFENGGRVLACAAAQRTLVIAYDTHRFVLRRPLYNLVHRVADFLMNSGY